MTAIAPHATRTEIPSLPIVALASVAAAVGLNALGVFGDGTDGAQHSSADFWVVNAVIAAAAVGVFALVVPRTQARAAGVGLSLSIAGLVLILAFWSGLTPIFAAGGMLLGWSARGRSGKATAALVLGALALIGYAATYVSDWMATNNIAGM